MKIEISIKKDQSCNMWECHWTAEVEESENFESSGKKRGVSRHAQLHYAVSLSMDRCNDYFRQQGMIDK